MFHRVSARVASGSIDRPEMLMGVSLVISMALLFAVIAMRGDQTVNVVGAAKSLSVGHVIVAEDLVKTKVPSSVQSMYVKPSEAAELIGQAVSQAVSQPGPISRAAVSRVDTSLKPHEALTAVALMEGSFPPNLAPGNTVRVVLTPSTDGFGGSVHTLQEIVVVNDISPMSDTQQHTVVTLRGTATLAEEIASSGPVHLSIVAVPK
jgi:hypothetical protein